MGEPRVSVALNPEAVEAYTVEVCPNCGRQEPHPHGKYRWQCKCGALLFVDAEEAAARPHYRQTQRIKVVPASGLVRRDEVEAWLRAYGTTTLPWGTTERLVDAFARRFPVERQEERDG